MEQTVDLENKITLDHRNYHRYKDSMANAFDLGKTAAIEGKTLNDNPYIDGTTKLGNPKFSDNEAGNDWQLGFLSGTPARVAGKAEMNAAAKVDISRFKRKSNRSYER